PSRASACRTRALDPFPTRRSSDLQTGTREIAAGNLDLSSRTEEQAANVEETAASMEELTSTVQQNLASVQTAAGLALETSRLARDRKSTRLNSSHVKISYAVFCVK